MDVVPQPDDRLVAAVVLEAELPHAARPAEEVPSGRRGEAEPPGRDHADDVAAGERQHVAADGLRPADEVVGAPGHVLGGLTAGAAVAEQLPAGPLIHDVNGHLPLVAAVDPLE